MPEKVTREERIVSLAIEKARSAKEMLAYSMENNRLPKEDDSEHVKVGKTTVENDKTKIENNTGTHSGYGLGGEVTDNKIKKAREDLLAVLKKAELPPRLKEGEADTQERNRKINDWANAYVRDVENQFRERARTHPTFGYFRFEGDKIKMDGYNQDFTYGQLANHIKNFMKDLEYRTSGQRYNYLNEMKRMATIPNKVVATLQSNSSYISEFDSYMQSQGY
tara:strand:+ start:223 stop:888 length:666 start_codon:yes stop_codon:yes gene_type:complete